MKKFLIAATAAAGLVFASSSAMAVAILPGGLSIDDKIFDTFTCSVSSSGNAAPFSNAGCASITGAVTESGSTAFMTLSSNFTATGPQAAGDTLITYHVHSTAGINLIDLGFDGRIFGAAATSVTETVHSGSLQGPVVGSLFVNCITGACTPADQNDPPLELGDIQLAGTFNDLYITKDIAYSAFLEATIATTSVITQSFHQVPEPASLALFGSALIALGALRRRRRKNTV